MSGTSAASGAWSAAPLPTREWGDPSGPVVVLLHGILGSGDYWHAVAELLPRHRVVAIDLLGFGRAPRPARAAYDYPEHCRAIVRTLDALGLDGRVTLVGHSMGALIALRLAADHPARVERLVLIGMPVFASAVAARRAIARTLIRRAMLYGPVSRLFCAVWCSALNPISRRIAPLYLRALPRVVASATVDHSWRSYSRSLTEIVERQSVAADVERVACPVVVLYGDEDEDAAVVGTWRRSGLTVQRLAGSHQLPLEQPRAIADIIGCAVSTEPHTPCDLPPGHG